MMYPKRLLVTALCILNILGYGAYPVPVSAQTDAPAVSVVTQSSETARLRRNGWKGFSQLSTGAAVQFGDLIDPKGGTVRVLCADLTERTITRPGPLPCPRERGVLVQSGLSLAGWQRGQSEDVTIPFLITPRATDVLTTHPLIWWNTTIDAEGYRITVRGDGLNWSTDIDDPAQNQLEYPDDAPPLKRGQTYTVVVSELIRHKVGHSSTEEDAPGMSFRVLGNAEAEIIRENADRLTNRLREAETRDMVLAFYYQQVGMKAEAVRLLMGLTGDLLMPADTSKLPAPKSAVLYLRLGDLCLETGIDLYASVAYAKALEIATSAGDVETQALAATGLAMLSPDADKRTAYIEQALTSWEKIGATSRLEELKKEFQLP
ncbi:MAG: hypothetical protein KF716_28320 [Anaerolineae bacterium]|nr:hypothetical protein [Anaerolineae bacterium]